MPLSEEGTGDRRAAADLACGGAKHSGAHLPEAARGLRDHTSLRPLLLQSRPLLPIRFGIPRTFQRTRGSLYVGERATTPSLIDCEAAGHSERCSSACCDKATGSTRALSALGEDERRCTEDESNQEERDRPRAYARTHHDGQHELAPDGHGAGDGSHGKSTWPRRPKSRFQRDGFSCHRPSS